MLNRRDLMRFIGTKVVILIDVRSQTALNWLVERLNRGENPDDEEKIAPSGSLVNCKRQSLQPKANGCRALVWARETAVVADLAVKAAAVVEQPAHEEEVLAAQTYGQSHH
jgi:hypothetical protein